MGLNTSVWANAKSGKDREERLRRWRDEDENYHDDDNKVLDDRHLQTGTKGEGQKEEYDGEGEGGEDEAEEAVAFDFFYYLL